VVGFPFAPSDMIIRRNWIVRSGLFDEQLVNGAEDIDFPCRLALDGCKFGSVDKALNFRRYHPGRLHKNLKNRKIEYDLVLDRTFNDTRFPSELQYLREKAIAKRDLNLVYVAFAQEETELGQAILQEAVQFDPAILKGEPSPLLDLLMVRSVSDTKQDHEALLKRVFVQFPEGLAFSPEQYDWAVMHGYLLKGLRATIWGDMADGEANFDRANYLGANFDEWLLEKLISQLTDIEEVLGRKAAKQAYIRLYPFLEKIGSLSRLRALEGRLFVNRAFRNFYNGEHTKVPGNVIQALANDPKLVMNRGTLSIFVRSILNY
jgi:hypothetical protein